MSENKTYLLKRLKRGLTVKRVRFTLYMVAVLWVAVATQFAVNYLFMEDFKITDAFIKAHTEDMQSKIEFIAEYNKALLSEEDKKGIIYHIADSIGLNIDRDITVLKEESKVELSFLKMAKSATTEIKVVSIENKVKDKIQLKHYIIVRLNILDSIKSIDSYKNKINTILNEIKVANKQTTLQYTGNYKGKLSSEERNQLVKLLVNELQGEVAIQYDEGDLYTVYAYSGLNNEYIVTEGKKVNIQIAITYNEVTDKTKVYLATPILNDSW